MNSQQQLFLIATLGITLMASAIAINLQPVEARNAGFEDGKRAGANDARNDRGFDDDCSSSNSLYCLAYIAGYRYGYELGNSIR